MLKVLIIALVALSVAADQDPPSPPFWGGNPQYTVKVLMTNDHPTMQWNFTYYYDATIHAERYEHQAPHKDEMCLLGNPPFDENSNCTIIFSDDGWSYIQYPEHNWCCKCGNTFHYINYGWLQANSTYVGMEKVNGYDVQHWTKPGQYLNHYYNKVDGLPVKFYELKLGKPKAWDFDLNTYKKGPVDHKLFEGPCQNLCGGNCKSYRQGTNNLVEQ